MVMFSMKAISFNFIIYKKTFIIIHEFYICFYIFMMTMFSKYKFYNSYILE